MVLAAPAARCLVPTRGRKLVRMQGGKLLRARVRAVASGWPSLDVHGAA